MLYVTDMLAARTIPKVLNQVGRRSTSHFVGAVIPGPPRYRVSFAEKFVTGSFMTACFLAYPTWVLVNIQNYKGHE